MSQKLFDSIAKKYERGNFLLSFGLHPYWNRKLVQNIGHRKELLDLCAGTGKVAFAFLKKNPEAKALLVDFSKEMLKIAQKRKKKFPGRSGTLLANVEKIPLADHSFDALSSAFGVRNINNLEKCFREAYRLLKDDGVFVILELTCPISKPLSALHRLYLKRALPLFSRLLFGDKRPYAYLAESILNFQIEKIRAELKKAGFSKIEITPLSFGIVTLIKATK